MVFPFFFLSVVCLPFHSSFLTFASGAFQRKKKNVKGNASLLPSQIIFERHLCCSRCFVFPLIFLTKKKKEFYLHILESDSADLLSTFFFFFLSYSSFLTSVRHHYYFFFVSLFSFFFFCRCVYVNAGLLDFCKLAQNLVKQAKPLFFFSLPHG